MYLRNQKGQGLIEYLVIVAVIGIATFSVLRVVGQNLSARFSSLALVLQGRSPRVEMDEIRDSHHSKKDLNNFFRDTVTRDQDN